MWDNSVLNSSKDENWVTPQELFDRLDEEFHFNLDPAASDLNHKCEKYYTIEDDGLSQNWGGYNVFCNPPYCRKTGDWVKKAWEESQKDNTTIVMLLPSRTDTRWFHDFVLGKAEIRFIRGRLKFGDSKNSAPFGSIIAIYIGGRNDAKKVLQNSDGCRV